MRISLLLAVGVFALLPAAASAVTITADGIIRSISFDANGNVPTLVENVSFQASFDVPSLDTDFEVTASLTAFSANGSPTLTVGATSFGLGDLQATLTNTLAVPGDQTLDGFPLPASLGLGLFPTGNLLVDGATDDFFFFFVEDGVTIADLGSGGALAINRSDLSSADAAGITFSVASDGEVVLTFDSVAQIPLPAAFWLLLGGLGGLGWAARRSANNRDGFSP